MINLNSQLNLSQPNNISNTENPTQNFTNDEWEKKFDFSFEVLEREYQSCIVRLRNVEEKANKYLVVISIFFAGYFTIISSSLADKIELATGVITYQNILPYFFLISFIIALIFGNITIYYLLRCLDLVEITRLPNIVDILQNNTTATANQFKGSIIQCYQNCIVNISEVTSNKQNNLRKVSKNIDKTVLFITISFIFLLVIKFQG